MEPFSLEDFAGRYNPFSSSQLEDPYPTYKIARREAPVFYSPVLHMWVVTRYDDIVAIYRNPAVFTSANLLKSRYEPTPEARRILKEGGYDRPPIIVDNDTPSHPRIRGAVLRSFTPGRAAKFEPALRALANELVDAFEGEGRVDLIPKFAYPIPIRVLFELLGVPLSDMDRVKRWVEEWVKFMWATPGPEEQSVCAHAMVAFRHYCIDLLEDRKRSPREDLMSALVQGSGSGEEIMTMNELAYLMNDLLFAGQDTTTTAIGNVVRLLLSYPDHFRALRSDPGLVPAAVEEAMRMTSPAQCGVRTTLQEAQIAGVTVPAGVDLCLVLGSAHRDEAHFPNPDTFDLRRGVHEKTLEFGNGRHACLGAGLARLELRVAVEVLSQRLPTLRLAPDQPVSYVPNLLSRSLSRLDVAWDLPAG